MAVIYLGLGSNVGNRREHLSDAIRMLSPNVLVREVSPIYESEPHGVSEPQPRYFNLALRATTDYAPQMLLSYLKNLEQALGRSRNTHNQPRPIDIDILLYDDLVHESDELTIPHPRMHERAFVLAPLSDIAPLAVHPTFNVVVAELEGRLGDYSSLAWLSEERL
ncbi:2-amino-4-hydroxy-6-hydroxymethyldihydropteridine diphosphokinase [Candidatus Kaiserbacteria bacterium]|nr:2-amino-4-hydroxy-6-hydroxymethyldihydropteridine diphosphokinase [Candidatus Kaiserbacteria bacterium]